MEKNDIMRLFMIAMSTSEFELIDGTIKALEHYKENLENWKIKQENERPEPPTPIVMMLLTKFQTIGLSYTDIFRMVSEHADVVNTASEFHQMLHDNNNKN